MDNAQKLFGQRLKMARKARGYTQKDLGRLVGVDANTIARVERGEQGMRWSALQAVFGNLGEPAAYYFSDQAAATGPSQKEKALAQRLDAIRAVLTASDHILGSVIALAQSRIDEDQAAAILEGVNAAGSGKRQKIDDDHTSTEAAQSRKKHKSAAR